jgi:hypothetical protein
MAENGVPDDGVDSFQTPFTIQGPVEVIRSLDS